METQSLNMPYLMVAGVMGFAVIFGFGVIEPAIGTAIETRDTIVESRITLAERQEFLRTLDSKVAELEINREHEARLATVLPRDERMEDALRILHRAAESSGLQIEQINNNSDATQAAFRGRVSRGEIGALPENVLPLSLNVSSLSSYQSMRAFLTTIERTPRLMDVTSISLQQDQQNPETLIGRISIEFYTITNVGGEI